MIYYSAKLDKNVVVVVQEKKSSIWEKSYIITLYMYMYRVG
jgi:hypothetical protein